jgi:alpha-amylase/alpha-mannosidase (GH57 family)
MELASPACVNPDIPSSRGNRQWGRWPLTVDKWADWIAHSAEPSVHVFVDYETFGEHQWTETGIFGFLRLGERVRAQADPSLLEFWRRLSTSDHCYYMCTKWFADGDAHKYFNPYESPYDAFVAFMNALTDLERRCEGRPSRVEVPAAEMGVIV